MPNYYAHLKFGAQVLGRLPIPMAQRLRQERAAFNLGCLGPDPLFFYHPATPNPVRREGLEIHKQSALPVFRRLRKAVEEGLPMSAGYAAGFLCHLALDSGCHGYVDKRTAEGGPTHLAMEAEFDRLLMEGDGLPIRGEAHMPPPPDRAVWTAAARAFLQAAPEQVADSYRAMRRVSGLLAGRYGTRLGQAVDWACGKFPALRGAKGVVLRLETDPACEESNRVLLRLMERAVDPAVEQIGAFFAAVEEGTPLSRWLDRDFGGGWEGDAAGSPSSALSY